MKTHHSISETVRPQATVAMILGLSKSYQVTNPPARQSAATKTRVESRRRRKIDL